MREKRLLTAASGSYPKLCDDPKQVSLRGALNKFDRQEISATDLEAVYRANITRVVKEQVAAGLDLVTDGQIRWDDLLNPFARNMEGVKIGGLTRFFDNNFYYRRPHIVGEVALKAPATVDDYLLASSVSSVPVKPVVVGPFTFAQLCADEHYVDIEKLTLAVARALKQELVGLQAAGAKMIQVDEPSLCFAADRVELAREA
jgi:5-methyltetrahydropteroyltriglutamate--homocysteine methyltransferase